MLDHRDRIRADSAAVCLFVGGPLDGELRSVSDDLDRLVIPVLGEPHWPRSGSPLDSLPVCEIVYVRVPLAGSSKHYNVFAPVAMSGDEIMERLLCRYAESKPARREGR